MNYEISFKTIQKYCVYRRINFKKNARFKNRCTKVKLVWPDNWDLDKDTRCTESNCPIVKRLWLIHPYIPTSGINI